MSVFQIIYLVMFFPCFFIACYYAFFALVSLFCHKQKYPMVEDNQKFCIFVPCHNEEPVIGATVENLLKMEYNPELYDVFFIADNCTDKTAEKIREIIAASGVSNFHCLERNEKDPTKKGKPHALRWGMDLLEEKDCFYNKYDMFMTLDADNFVDANILKHMNSQFLSYKESKRPVMIQSYLDSKNKNNLIARGYYVCYRYTNGFYQLPRHKLGLTPGIGGTGFSITTKFLKEIGGYNCKSLVEDLEIQTIATLRGKKIAYNHNTRIYDEKPTGVKQSTVQKTRWSQGHWWVFFKYSWRLFFRMFNPKEIKFFFKRLDCLINLSALIIMILGGLIFIYPIILWILNIPFGIPILQTISSVIFIFMILMFPISSLIDGKQEEKKRILIDFIPNMLSILINAVLYYIANIVGLLHCKNQTVWKKTAHKITDMSSTKVNPECKQTPVIAKDEKLRVMVVFGTRPEAIKMAPLVIALQKRKEIETIVCVTAQHRQMLDQVLEVFNIKPDYDLNIMKPNQTLSMITSNAMLGLEDVIKERNPHLMLVHGDTTTSYAGAMAAFYNNVKIGHVEAGLRTYNLHSPFPEEANRVFVDTISDLYFAPTELSKQNLLKENKNKENIYVTGNTAIDALKYTVQDNYTNEILDWAKGSRLIMLTAHRRENLGQPMRNFFSAIKRVIAENPDVKVVYPVHLNPIVQNLAKEMFGDEDRVKLIEPLNVIDFHNFMKHSYMILTDSGGVQEEAPSLGKPVIVLRDTTERPEGVKAGTLKLAGTNEDKVYSAITKLLKNEKAYKRMSKTKNPYGDGNSSEKIVDAIINYYKK